VWLGVGGVFEFGDWRLNVGVVVVLLVGVVVVVVVVVVMG
jgi:hypothetical protein